MSDKSALIAQIRANVPQLLRELPVWLLHDAEKTPYYVNGEKRHGDMDTPNDRAHFVRFEAAAEALLRLEHVSGLGVALGEVPGEDMHLCGMDLDDHCYTDDVPVERVQQVLLAADSYAERSPSGTGLHVLGTGDIGTLKVEKTADTPGLELYSGGRYFTVTGVRLNGARIEDIREGAAFARKLWEAPAVNGSGQQTPSTDKVLEEIQRQGLYLRPGQGGKHLICCPWKSRHTPNERGDRQTSESEAAYCVPGAVLGERVLNWGYFKCQHTHCSDRGLRELREFLGLVKPDSGGGWVPPAVVTYGAGFDPARIPLRRWLLGHRRSVGEVTVDSGPPGVNKSTLLLTDGVAIATCRALLADKVHEYGEVLYLAGEDARRDVEARIAGILQYYRIAPAELADKLHVVYLAEVDPVGYTLAQMVDDLATLNTHMLEWLRDYPKVIAVFIDPLAAWHRLIENSNEALQLLCSSMRSLAVQGKRHVGIDHHVTKVAMSDPEAHVGNLAAVRGAGAITAYTRWAFTLARLKLETANELGLPEDEYKRYRRLDSLKASYGPDDDTVRLLRVDSVVIANGENVGVLVEVDTERTREQATKRKVSAAEEAKGKLAAALTRMLVEKRPRSANAAALWLAAHCADLFTKKGGKPLAQNTVRLRLPGLIGSGLDTTCHGRPARIVTRVPEKDGQGFQIDFEQTDMVPSL